MQHFDVIITRDTTESCTMVIEAETAADAETAAIGRARSDHDLVWEQDETPNLSGDPYVTHIAPTI